MKNKEKNHLVDIGLRLIDENDNQVDNIFTMFYHLHETFYNRELFINEFLVREMRREILFLALDISRGKKEYGKLYGLDKDLMRGGLKVSIEEFDNEIYMIYDKIKTPVKTPLVYEMGMKILNNKNVIVIKKRYEKRRKKGE